MVKKFLTMLQMQRLARLEDTFDKYISGASMADPGADLDFEGIYHITLEDLETAYENLVEEDMPLKEAFLMWFFPMTQADDHFIVDIEDEDEMPNEITGLSLTETEMTREVWNHLRDVMGFIEYLIVSGDETVPLVSDFTEIAGMLETIRLFWDNMDKPVMEREFTMSQKTAYIGQFSDESFLDEASDIEVELCRKITDELCEQDDNGALELKGYACYGGNRLYDCDWEYSRDCMEKLFDMTDDAMYANTLGYIYYYGRCNGGVPEYDKAFPMFVTSAANGIYEGIYKLADMYKNGYGCRKSPNTAFKLYRFVYDDCYGKFIDGYDAKFADAALRLGDAYHRGIGVDKDLGLAYAYYLQAALASKMRVKEDDFFGNTSVALGIRKSLARVKRELPENFFEPYYSETYPSIMENMVDGGFSAQISVSGRKNGNCDLNIIRIPAKNDADAAPLMLCMPALDHCALTDRVKLRCVDVKLSSEFDGRRKVFYDSIEWDARNGKVILYDLGKQVGWIEAGEYRFYAPRKKKAAGQVLNFVSVSFSEGGRTYDYLCDIPNVKIGDKVIVNGYEGETEVTVKELFTADQTELGIPLERFKSVLRKA